MSLETLVRNVIGQVKVNTSVVLLITRNHFNFLLKFETSLVIQQESESDHDVYRYLIRIVRHYTT